MGKTDMKDLAIEGGQTAADAHRLADVGIIGGYGISQGFESPRMLTVETPYGAPSHPLILGTISNTRVALLPRHGSHHQIPSHAVNYRANVWALHNVGARRVISAIAAGSLVQQIAPGHIALPADYIDVTKRRADTFHDGEPVHHFSSSDSFCPSLRAIGARLASALDFDVHPDVTAIATEGPRFATIAESLLYQKMGAHIVNMSFYPEVALARELGMCFCCIALITDYDAGQIGEMRCSPVTLNEIDRVQAAHKHRCTELICSTAVAASDAACQDCAKHITGARKHSFCHGPN